MLFLVPAPPIPGIATSTPATSTQTVAGIPDLITVDMPQSGASVALTTLTVRGSARGTWYFEASFPVVVLDASGAVIAQKPAQAQSDWMTQDFVPFTATLTYPAQMRGSRGTLVLKKDNPSGDPSKDQQVLIPIVFN